MKQDYRAACKQAILHSDVRGYKWTVTSNGLKWSYCDVEFTFVDDGEFLSVRDNFDEPFISIWYGDDKYAECKTLTEAYYIATKRTIRRANHLY